MQSSIIVGNLFPSSAAQPLTCMGENVIHHAKYTLLCNCWFKVPQHVSEQSGMDFVTLLFYPFNIFQSMYRTWGSWWFGFHYWISWMKIITPTEDCVTGGNRAIMMDFESAVKLQVTTTHKAVLCKNGVNIHSSMTLTESECYEQGMECLHPHLSPPATGRVLDISKTSYFSAPACII